MEKDDCVGRMSRSDSKFGRLLMALGEAGLEWRRLEAYDASIGAVSSTRAASETRLCGFVQPRAAGRAGRAGLIRNMGGSDMSISLVVNGIAHTVDVEPETPLLWVLRDSLKLTGTKFGCGIAQCGACTVLIDGQATRSCAFPISALAGKPVTTIEGLSSDGTHPVQLAWIEFDVPQCGYCQSGQIMAAVSLLKQKPKPTNAEIDANMTNICRRSEERRVGKE